MTRWEILHRLSSSAKLKAFVTQTNLHWATPAGTEACIFEPYTSKAGKQSSGKKMLEGAAHNWLMMESCHLLFHCLYSVACYLLDSCPENKKPSTVWSGKAFRSGSQTQIRLIGLTLSANSSASVPPAAPQPQSGVLPLFVYRFCPFPFPFPVVHIPLFSRAHSLS